MEMDTEREIGKLWGRDTERIVRRCPTVFQPNNRDKRVAQGMLTGHERLPRHLLLLFLWFLVWTLLRNSGLI